tara:strand:+ start:226 stop:615 length:390 start_codon:yes stop_codon:yes gene_type:complete
MPKVRYNGPSFNRRSPDPYTPVWTRGETREVKQEWVDKYRPRLPAPYFTLEGDEAPTVDEGNDGIPDDSWRRADISAWLGSQGVEFAASSYRTKTKLLQLVDQHLNPPAPEPEVLDEEPPVEEQQETGE